MSPGVPSSEHLRYNYSPWASTPSNDSDLNYYFTSQAQPTSSSNAYASEVDSHNAPFDNGVRSFDCQSTPSRLGYEIAEAAALASPKQAVSQLQGHWPDYSSYYSPSPSYSSSESRAVSELPSTSWASPNLSCTYSPRSSIPRSSIDSNAVLSSLELMTPRTSVDSNAATSHSGMLPPRTSVDCNISVTSMEMLPPGSCSLSDVQQFAEPDAASMFDFDNINEPSVEMSIPPTYVPFQMIVQAIEPFPPLQYQFETYPIPESTIQTSSRESPQCDYTTTRERPRNRHQSLAVTSSRYAPTRVSKKSPTPTSRRVSAPVALSSPQSSSKGVSPSRSSRTSQTGSNFPCPLAPYGCPSSFGSKNEWKRHVNTQHLRLDMWRCDQCSDRDTRPNDFNRKDLFIQHLRRMHHRASEERTLLGRPVKPCSLSTEDTDPAIALAEQRCHIRLRHPPAHSCCLFCPTDFSGHGSWEERMEHIGRHLEQDKKDGNEAPALSTWRHDQTVEAWLETEGLIVRAGYEWQIADGRRNVR